MDIDPVEAILQFWFGEAGSTLSTTYSQQRQLWFSKQSERDTTIRERFGAIHKQAMAGELDAWQDQALSCLALIVVLDQFSRNMFRDTPQAFASDSKALSLAQHAVEQGFDQELHPLQRIFLYLPFEHSESLEDQAQSVELFDLLGQEMPELTDVVLYARRHQDVIKQFGRFPHRNEILGRDTTPEEAEFLTQPGSSF
jgi:uncharacterized protein (DUF924 family)